MGHSNFYSMKLVTHWMQNVWLHAWLRFCVSSRPSWARPLSLSLPISSLSIPFFAFCSMGGVKICNILTSGALINVDLLKNCTFVLLKENRLITKTIDKFSTSFQININAISDILDKQSSGNHFLGVYGVYNKIEVNRNLMIENKDDTFKFYDFL